MAAIKAAPPGEGVGRSEWDASSADAATIAERIGASEEEVRQAFHDPERVRTVMRERHLTMELAVFQLIANAQARRRRDATITVPAGD